MLCHLLFLFIHYRFTPIIQIGYQNYNYHIRPHNQVEGIDEWESEDVRLRLILEKEYARKFHTHETNQQ